MPDAGRPDVVNQRLHVADVVSHCRRNSEYVGLAVGDGTEDALRRDVGTKIVGVPALHLEKVGDHTHAQFV